MCVRGPHTYNQCHLAMLPRLLHSEAISRSELRQMSWLGCHMTMFHFCRPLPGTAYSAAGGRTGRAGGSGGPGGRRAGGINDKSEEFREPSYSSNETSSFNGAAADADFTARGRRCGRSSRKE